VALDHIGPQPADYEGTPLNIEGALIEWLDSGSLFERRKISKDKRCTAAMFMLVGSLS
jgi:hypothetical protein